MKFFFTKQNPQQVVDAILEQLGGRELGKMVSIDINQSDLDIVISKFGTSKLKFTSVEKNGGLEFSLVDEKIAFAHRAFKDEVTQKLSAVIEKAGGKLA